MFLSFQVNVGGLKVNIHGHGGKNVQKKTVKLSCDVDDCTEKFDTRKQLDAHKRNDHGKSFPCKIEGCDKVLGSAASRVTHVKTHQFSEGEYPCGVCGEVFDHYSVYEKHFRRHNPDKMYRCRVGKCPCEYVQPSDRDRHEKTHQQVELLKCNIGECSYESDNAKLLAEHKKHTHGPAMYRCNCSFASQYRASLKRHLEKNADHTNCFKVEYNPDDDPENDPDNE